MVDPCIASVVDRGEAGGGGKPAHSQAAKGKELMRDRAVGKGDNGARIGESVSARHHSADYP